MADRAQARVGCVVPPLLPPAGSLTGSPCHCVPWIQPNLRGFAWLLRCPGRWGPTRCFWWAHPAGPHSAQTSRTQKQHWRDPWRQRGVETNVGNAPPASDWCHKATTYQATPGTDNGCTGQGSPTELAGNGLYLPHPIWQPLVNEHLNSDKCD